MMNNRLIFAAGLLLLASVSTAALAAPATKNMHADNAEAELMEDASEADYGSEMFQDINLHSVQAAYDKVNSRATVKYWNWEPDSFLKLRLRKNMRTLIHLPKGSEVDSIINGDEMAFTVKPLKYSSPKLANMTSVECKYPGTDTNLVIIDDASRLYNFYLRCDPIKSSFVSDYTVYVNAPISNSVSFQYTKNDQPEQPRAEVSRTEVPRTAVPRAEAVPEQNQGDAAAEIPLPPKVIAKAATSKDEYLATLPKNRKVNTAYKMYGDKEVAPFAVYDDGIWTYFDFRGLVGDRLPVIYKVVDGYDSVLNTRVQDGFLVAESMSFEGWTLRNGDKTVCVKPTRDLKLVHKERPRAQAPIFTDEKPKTPPAVSAAPALRSSQVPTKEYSFSDFNIKVENTYPQARR